MSQVLPDLVMTLAFIAYSMVMLLSFGGLLTWVERNFGYAIARAYAGHTDNTGSAGTTATYVRASLPEVAAALASLTGEAHPLTVDSPATAAAST